MLPGRERRLGLLTVQVIWSRDVDDLDPRVGEHRLEALVGRKSQVARTFHRALAARAHDSVHLHAQPAQGLHVHHSDETGAGHGGADVGDRSQSRLRYQFRCALASRVEGMSLAGATAAHHATALAMTRWISGWWYTGNSWSAGPK